MILVQKAPWIFSCIFSSYPTGLGRWDLMRQQLLIESTRQLWEVKKEQAFFRGSRTSTERDEWVLINFINENLKAFKPYFMP